MNPLLQTLTEAFAMVVQASWKATVLIGLVRLVQVLFRKFISPGWRYGLWLLLVLRLAMPALPQSSASVFNLTKSLATAGAREHVFTLRGITQDALDFPRQAPELPQPKPVAGGTDRVGSPAGPLENATSPGTFVIDPPVWKLTAFQLAALLWWLGACAIGCRHLTREFRFRRRLNRTGQRVDKRVEALFSECANILCVSRKMVLVVTPEVDSPGVFGVWRKRLLLPSTTSRFSDDELRCIFLHELAHVKRRDPEVNVLLLLLNILHWFNPALWFAFQRMRADRELACDAIALSGLPSGGNIDYGETILKVMEQCTSTRTFSSGSRNL